MNTITIELCAEDRARLDRLTAALESCTIMVTGSAVPKYTGPSEGTTEPAETPEKEAEVKTLADTHPVEESLPWGSSEAEEPQKPAPKVTLEQIQQKVVQLCAAFGGKKKAQVREIIGTYGAKVSDLKDQPEKWDEVWNKLARLEIEEV